MKHAQHTIRSLAALALALLLLSSAALAAEVQVDRAAVYCFSGADFQSGGSGELTGIYVSSVPSALSCQIRYGARALRAGDVLPAEALSRLVLSPTSRSAVQSEFVYCPITAEGLGTQQTLKLKILSGKNEPPEAENSALETYKNIANTGTLKASDPEGGPLTYTLVKEPKRGTVTLNADGSFTYTPKQNKVGRDKFVYTAADADGNVSQEATVTVKIVKPTDRARYADMAGDEAEYTAMWLKDEGVYAGRTVAGSLCFEPDSAVTRGEFLVMAMKLLGAEPESAALTSGFADEESTPAWMRPYIAAALKNGAISGVSSEAGLVFRPDAALTKAEAAVMLRNMLRLPEAETTSVFSFGADAADVPAWAASAVSTLEEAGISMPADTPAETISRREAAGLLYSVWQLTQAKSDAAFRAAA